MKILVNSYPETFTFITKAKLPTFQYGCKKRTALLRKAMVRLNISSPLHDYNDYVVEQVSKDALQDQFRTVTPNYEQERRKEWNSFLESLVKDGEINAIISRTSSQFLDFFSESVGFQIPMPTSVPDGDGALLMYWDSSDHHLEVTISKANSFDWFYRNRISERVDSGMLAIDTKDFGFLTYLGKAWKFGN